VAEPKEVEAPAATGDRVAADVAESGMSWIDPSKLRLFRTGSGDVRATVRGQRSVLRPALHRAFPVTAPEVFIELREENGESVGMLRGLSSLDAASRRLAEELLRERYLVPVIEEIRGIRSEYGLWLWDVVTDRGEREFAIRSPRDDVRPLPAPGQTGRRVRITDVDGNTYEIGDLDRLPSRSRWFFDRIA
jgi:hypothetical protein